MDSKSSEVQNRSQNDALHPFVDYRSIRLAEVDSKDETFRITTRIDVENLVDTIQSFGLLQPPLLSRHSSEYKIVGGFRRIGACRRLGRKHITAGIVKASIEGFKLAQLAIADNVLQRSLNLVEVSRALNLLADRSPNQEQVRKASVILGLPTRPTVAAKVKKICRLPLSIQEAILMDTINMSMALELGKMRAADAAALVALFHQIKVGLNKQRELHLLLTEIAKREDSSIERLIAEKPLRQMLQNTEMDRAAQRHHIRSYLRQRRYPAISKAEADYQKWVRQLQLGDNIKLVPPKDFEGTTYAMTLHFENQQDLGDLEKKIEKIRAHPALAKILNR